MPPNYMCEQGKNGSTYFNKEPTADGKNCYSLKSMEEYMLVLMINQQKNVQEQPSKRYFAGNTLSEIIHGYPIMRKGMTNREIEFEMQNRRSFVDFLSGLLRYNPLQRWTPQQALQHPYITQKPFLEPFNPLNVTPLHSDISNDTNNSNLNAMKPRAVRQASDPFLEQNLHYYAQDRKKSGIPDYNYQQVVGHFSGFQINPASIPFSLPDKSGQGPSSLTNKSSFPMRKAKSQFNVTDTSFGSLPQHQLSTFQSTPAMNNESQQQASYSEIHPRHGNFGERTRIPSRMPSSANSVDWEIFNDYEGNSYAGSYAGSFSGGYPGSRNNSFADLSPGGDMRRGSLNFSNSPKQRHLGFHRIPPGSYSNDSFINESDNYFRNSFSGPINTTNNAFLSASQQSRGHKKQRSISSLPPQSPDLRSSRRPSVPNSLFSSSQKSSKPSLSNSSFQSERRSSIPGIDPDILNPFSFDTEDEQSLTETHSSKTTSKPINLPGYEYQEPNRD